MSTGKGALVTSGIPELDEVLGGGIPAGGVILLAGHPGCDLPAMIAFSALLIPLINNHHGLKRRHGLVLVLAYGGYIYSLV